jgi:hypothetical protein
MQYLFFGFLYKEMIWIKRSRECWMGRGRGAANELTSPSRRLLSLFTKKVLEMAFLGSDGD